MRNTKLRGDEKYTTNGDIVIRQLNIEFALPVLLMHCGWRSDGRVNFIYIYSSHLPGCFTWIAPLLGIQTFATLFQYR